MATRQKSKTQVLCLKIFFISYLANHRYRGPDGRAMDEAKIGREETHSWKILSIPPRQSGITLL
jgi:hypothetical protein